VDSLKAWFKRHFSDPQVVLLALLLLIGMAVIAGLGRMLWPVFASIVIAYLLEAGVQLLQRFGLARLPSVILVFLVFLAGLIFALFGLVPMLSRQLAQLVSALPGYFAQGQELLAELPRRYPQLLSENQVETITANVSSELARFGQQALGWSLSSVANVVGLIVLLVLVPVLVFFFMKDKDRIIAWFVAYLPRERHLVTRVWDEVEGQISNYVRGKAGEILIVGGVSYVTFTVLGLQYSALLATLVGFSVLIPYVGALAVTLPVAMVAYFQFGWTWEFGWVVIAYTVIQMLDGNVLVPLMFSEAVNLHPVAIIVAILVFGGLWGFWGVFFAIPLATLVQAVLNAWPRNVPGSSAEDDSSPERTGERSDDSSRQSTSEA
jgi:putative permease